MPKFVRLVLVSLGILCFVSCKEKNQRPSVYLLLVENLGFEEGHCEAFSRRYHREIFPTICKSSVSYSKFFTTSVLTVPAVASVFTGKYPFELNIWNNGNQSLSGLNKTIAELAYREGYRTSFFSSGAPLLSKTGLDQGFELFDDSVNPAKDPMYRPARDLFSRYQKWSEQIGSSRPEFSVFYLQDLQHFNKGNIEKSNHDSLYEESLIETSRSVEQWVSHLKEKGKWVNSIVAVVGLKASQKNKEMRSERHLEITPERLHSLFLLKPPSSWELNLGELNHRFNVSMADLGTTFYKYFSSTIPFSKNRALSTISLFDLFRGQPVFSDLTFRPVIVESGWGNWHGISASRFGVITNRFFYPIESELRSLPIGIRPRSEETLVGTVSMERTDKIVSQLVNRIQFPEFEEPNPGDIEAFRFVEEVLQVKPTRKLKKKWNRIKNENPQNELVDFIGVRIAFEIEDWNWLFQLSKNQGLSYILAFLNNLDPKFPFAGTDNCFELLDQQKAQFEKIKKCQDYLFLSLYKWVGGDKSRIEKRRSEDQFIRDYLRYQLERKVSVENWRQGLIWDINPKKYLLPNRTELALELPYFLSLKKSLGRK